MNDEKGVIYCVIPDVLSKAVMDIIDKEQFQNHLKRSQLIFCKTSCRQLPLNTVDPSRWPVQMEDSEMVNQWLVYERDPDWVSPADYRGTYPTVQELLQCAIVSPANVQEINILSILLELELKSAD